MNNVEIEPAYCYDLQQTISIKAIEARAIVHFRPSSTWKGLGYGFDWMRCGDYKDILAKAGQDEEYTEGDIPYKDLITIQCKAMRGDENYKPSFIYQGKPYSTTIASGSYDGEFIPDSETYKKLEKVYSNSDILYKPINNPPKEGHRFEQYYCSWLSIYPGKTITLSLVVEIDKQEWMPDEIVFEYNDEFFDVAWKNGKPQLAVGKNILPDAITVNCKKGFSEQEFFKKDLAINAFAIKKEGSYTKKRFSGRMLVWHNNTASQKIANIIFINVQTKEEETIHNYESFKEEIRCYLQQALIDFKDIPNMNVNLKDDPNLQEGGRYFIESDRLRIDFNNKEIPNLANYLNNIFEQSDAFKNLKLNFANCLKVYSVDQTLYDKWNTPIAASSVGQTQAILVSPWENKPTSLAHEILHALGLAHSFTNNKNRLYYMKTVDFTYTAFKTENIMDYSDIPGVSTKVIPLYSLWKWQWAQANKKVTANGNVIVTKNDITPQKK